MRHLAVPALFFVTDQARVADPLTLVARLPRGSGVILRDYEMPKRAELAGALMGLARRRDLRLLVAGDGRLAESVGAAGLHLPEARRCEALIWRTRHPKWLITVAAHSAAALLAAAQLQADAALLGPVFPTESHPGSSTMGAAGFTALAQFSPLPVIALGGLNERNVDQLYPSPVVGIAAIGGLAEELAE